MTELLPPVAELSPFEALERARSGALLLDVREDDEWAAGRAPEARHLALGALASEHPSLPRGQLVVCACRSGGRSARAADFLRQAGFEVANLAGGMKAWAMAGLPVEDGAGRTGTII